MPADFDRLPEELRHLQRDLAEVREVLEEGADGFRAHLLGVLPDLNTRGE